ncbi:hypothetical protein PC9H_007551 [Pleurotus ostreatus]|uniref:Protein-S-isoprenylcysteine O-methyltransferase n=1 Tax=Pleurotus ostreatus TaxID=5322 RepID=A0A8H7DSV3_PLEOS|nr:uncharacterized protein PC9H_007551 [Pleurotus ostreatus]KAF7428330.1 hypothetical protein PC9H_007551 [Pleurotus ostreatus]KAJ8696442.1 hypothetical protein PTI98_006311 [Pleurotus ostreatus]
MASTLMKIPFIWAAMFALHVAATPPNPPASKEERTLSTKHESFMNKHFGRAVVEILCLIGATAETICILATQAPLSSTTQALLTLCSPSGPASAYRIALSPAFFWGILICVFGGFIRYKSYTALGPMFTFEVAIRDNHKLITHGPYAYIRHPSYIGVPLTVLGIAIYHASPGSWFRECDVLRTRGGMAAVAVFGVLMSLIISGLMKRVEKEDEMLRQKFGKQWDEWAERVPYRLIPMVY